MQALRSNEQARVAVESGGDAAAKDLHGVAVQTAPTRREAANGSASDTAPGMATAKPAPATAKRRSFNTGLANAAKHVVPPLVTMAALVGIWQITCSSPDASLPPPSKVVSDTWELIADPFFDRGGLDKGLFWHLLASLQRVAVGYMLAVIVGVAFGVLVGSSVWAMRALDPLFQVLRTIPPLAWLPLSLAAFRNGQPSAIFVIFITAVWPIIINTAVGIRNIPQDFHNVARVLRLNGAEYFSTIMLPAAAPYIFTGLRIGIGLSWLAIVAAEMLVGGVGIGFFIWDAWNSSLISDIILALLYVGIIGFLLDRSIALLARFITRGTASN